MYAPKFYLVADVGQRIGQRKTEVNLGMEAQTGFTNWSVKNVKLYVKLLWHSNCQ